MNELVYVMVNMRLTKKETKKREPFEFIDGQYDILNNYDFGLFLFQLGREGE